MGYKEIFSLHKRSKILSIPPATSGNAMAIFTESTVTSAHRPDPWSPQSKATYFTALLHCARQAGSEHDRTAEISSHSRDTTAGPLKASTTDLGPARPTPLGQGAVKTIMIALTATGN